MVHLPFLIGKLPCSIGRILVHKVRRKDFFIACGDISVEEEIDQGALEDGSLTRIHRKSSTGDLHSSFKIDQSVGFGQFPMGLMLLA